MTDLRTDLIEVFKRHGINDEAAETMIRLFISASEQIAARAKIGQSCLIEVNVTDNYLS